MRQSQLIEKPAPRYHDTGVKHSSDQMTSGLATSDAYPSLLVFSLLHCPGVRVVLSVAILGHSLFDP